MLDDTSAPQPATDDLTTKELMAEDWDYLIRVFAPMPGYMPPLEVIMPWRLAEAVVSLARRTQAAEEEQKRVASRNVWIKALRSSLSPETP